MNISDTVKTILPWIGTALGGPLGGIAANIVGNSLGLSDSTVTTVKAVLTGMSPEKLAELSSAESSFKLKAIEFGYDNLEKLETINANVVIEVNKTMQLETQAEHWPSYSWRPFIGFMFGLYIMSMWMLPLFHVMPTILTSETVLAIGGILGVASWFRGKAQADPIVQNTATITQKG